MYSISDIKNTIIQGDSLEVLKQIPDESIDCVMTSPPYWALRDYGTATWEGGDPNCDHKIPKGESDPKQSFDGSSGSHAIRFNRESCHKCGAIRKDQQLGLEPTFQEYINRLCDIFDEVKRVLKKEGTCWVNMGDTYMNDSSYSKAGRQGYGNDKVGMIYKDDSQCPKKSLCQIPSRFAIEMCNRGWILRNSIVWWKPNCMPSSVKDRFTVDYEMLFFFSKSKKYYFETQYEKAIYGEQHANKTTSWGKNRKHPNKNNVDKYAFIGDNHTTTKMADGSYGRNKRCVWRITTKPYKEAHFATYPEALCETPIKAGCPEFVCKKCGKAREKIIDIKTLERYELNKDDPNYRPARYEGKYKQGMRYAKKTDKGYTDCGCGAGWEGGIVLDPFFGAGTTGLVAKQLRRNYIGIELNPAYIKIAEDRLRQQVLL